MSLAWEACQGARAMRGPPGKQGQKPPGRRPYPQLPQGACFLAVSLLLAAPPLRPVSGAEASVGTGGPAPFSAGDSPFPALSCSLLQLSRGSHGRPFLRRLTLSPRLTQTQL